MGDELPPLELPITPTVIIAGAIASRDFQDVHHDRDLAVQRGSKDIFMNILTTNGYVGRFVTDWAGPEGLLRSVDIRLGAPNYAGDTMKMTGRVKEKRDGVLTIEIVGVEQPRQPRDGGGDARAPARRLGVRLANDLARKTAIVGIGATELLEGLRAQRAAAWRWRP